MNREGLSVAVAYQNRIVEWAHRYKPKEYLYLNPKSENEGFAVTGANGAGKTTLINHLVDSFKARSRREGRKCATVFFDPHGTFISRYWTPSSLVANPYDKRSFSWCPTWELDLTKQRVARARGFGMARSLYVGQTSKSAGDNSVDFFNRAAQLLFTQLVVDHQPEEAQTLAYWMENPDEEIAPRVTGKVKKDLDEGSAAQANGIYSVASMPQIALDSIPLSGWLQSDGTWHENAPRFTVREFCQNRDRDIFFSADSDQMEILQPMYSMWLDMLFRDLLKPSNYRRAKEKYGYVPDVCIVVDELAAAQRLPMLRRFANEARKFGNILVLGFQSKSQLDGIYGAADSSTIIGACKHQCYFRPGERDGAKWSAENIGEIEYEFLSESWSTSMGQSSKPRTVQPQEKKKLLFQPSEMTGLKKRQMVLKVDNEVARFKVAFSAIYEAAPEFIPREDSPVRKGVKRPKKEPKVKAPKGKGKSKKVDAPAEEQAVGVTEFMGGE